MRRLNRPYRVRSLTDRSSTNQERLGVREGTFAKRRAKPGTQERPEAAPSCDRFLLCIPTPFFRAKLPGDLGGTIVKSNLSL